MSYSFHSTILILPGLSNSGEGHWQTRWEKQFNFIRVEQKEWETPVCHDWIETLDKKIMAYPPERVILVGHSLGCATIAFWALHFKRKIKGALLVAPSDTEAPSYPAGTSGFSPMPMNRLPFPSLTVFSHNDFYVTPSRAKLFSDAWGSELIDIGNAQHINTASGFGDWREGLALLKRLDK